MKGFIQLTMQNGDDVLVNTSKIRVVSKTATGCSISLDEPSLPSAIEGVVNGVIGQDRTVRIDLKHKFAPRRLLPKQSFDEVLRLIDLAL